MIFFGDIILLCQKRKFAIFNRTQYENVLVTRVHPEYILNENLPGIESIENIPEDFWKKEWNRSLILKSILPKTVRLF